MEKLLFNKSAIFFNQPTKTFFFLISRAVFTRFIYREIDFRDGEQEFRFRFSENDWNDSLNSKLQAETKIASCTTA